MFIRSELIGFGHYLPQKILTNDDLSNMVETSDEWIRTRTGICSRHISEDETTSVMAGKAVTMALENAGLSGKTVIPFCTSQDNDVDLSMDLIRKAAPEATVLEGIRLHGADEETVKAWLEDIYIPFEE
jgi:hypothetical protein